MNKVFLSAFFIVASAVFVSPSAFAFDDPPTRAARLSYVQGDVSLQPGDSDDWTWASLNRPLTTGDSIWTQRRGRAEIRIGSTAVRADEQTSLSILNLDDHTSQFGLNSGTIIVHVRYLSGDESIEVDTPNAAVSIIRAGDYRIEADESGDYSSVSVRKGEAEVSGPRDSFTVNADSEAQISGTDRLTYDVYDLPSVDAFDRWSTQRDWRAQRSRSARYVSTELTGYEDLDTNGSWINDETYGSVWAPSRVEADWTPFSDGRWVWVSPWGWTWLDSAPWGYATSHYGRWAYLNRAHRWCWVPPRHNAGENRWPVYSPANVVFVRDTHDYDRRRHSVAWFPLGPGEAYVPGYRTSRGYVERMNGTNTYMREPYDSYRQRRPISERAYTNALIAGAVVAVAAEVFSSARPVSRSRERFEPHAMMSKEVISTAPVAPVKASELAPPADKTAVAPPPKPPEQIVNRRVVAKQAPPPKPVKFDRKQRLLEQNAGQPLDSDAEKSLRAEAPAPVPVVQTISPAVTAKPAETVEKKPRPPHMREHGRHEEEQPGQPATATAPQQPPTGEPAQPVTAAPPAEKTPKERAEQERAQREQQRAEERQKAEEQRQVEKEQADQQRQQQEEQKKAEKEQADQQRQQQEEQKKAEKEQQQQEADQARQQRDLERQQKQEEQRKAKEDAEKARGQEQSEPDQQQVQPEQPAPEEQQIRHHSERGSYRHPGSDAEPASASTPQQDEAPGGAGGAAATPVPLDAGTAAQKLVSQPKLRYPREAEKAGVEGTVKVQTVIGPDGRVKNATATEGPEELKDAAKENVQRRRYQPTVVNGKPVEVQTEVSVDFQKPK